MRIRGMLRVGCIALWVIALLASWPAHGEPTVAQTMDDIVTRLYATMTEAELGVIDNAAVMAFTTPEERAVLATQYWHFDVDVPVLVSVLRTVSQKDVPFWLPEAGFVKTDLKVFNIENWEYEVWQKRFDAGHVGLGINGFDKHREHYLVAVGPQNEGDAVSISNLFPSEFSVETMQDGATCYHDWGSLVLRDVPASLVGHRLLTTIRGRAREAHLIGGFRQTQWPSTSQPRDVVLTWSEDPKTTQSVQWRTSTDVSEGLVQFKKKGAEGGYTDVPATFQKVQNRLLANDRFCHYFTGVVRGLEPGTEYLYRVGSPGGGWSEETAFRTAPADPAPFTFVTFGDTHNQEAWGKMLEGAFARHPETAFYTIAGDLVGTGQYRDDWDAFFARSAMVFNQRPIAPVIGNHDVIDGLGSWLYQAVFALPEDGPPKLTPERAYSFEYGNALFLMLDCTSSEEDQAAWLEEQLANTKATWKFAFYHFPPYSLADDEYPGIRYLWGGLFDKYHVDFALEGHVHYYMRSHPIYNDTVADSPAEGTIHLISIGIPSGRPGVSRPFPDAWYAAKQYRGDAMYQTFAIDGNRLEFTSYLSDGTVFDTLVIEK